MSLIYTCIAIAGLLMFGEYADSQASEGKPILPPALTGFSPTNFLPAAQEQVVEYDDDEDTHPSLGLVHDPQVDDCVGEWLAEHADTSAGLPPHTPETPSFTAVSTPVSTFETKSKIAETPDISLVENKDVSTPVSSFDPSFDQPLDITAEQDEELEFDLFSELVEQGMSATGKDIIYKLWGLKPGNSKAYREAVRRRKQYADKLVCLETGRN